jgi:hypothetical protein
MPNYSGIWTEQAVMQAVGAGNWPGNPGAPTIGTATAGDASASVTFTAPTDTGQSAIVSYTVTSSPGSLTGTGSASPITVSGLTNGTAYTFTVTAANATGTGPASAASNSVTPVPPVYIEDVYSTYLYTGNGSTQTITNGIDLSTNGGLVWLKSRSLGGEFHRLFDTSRGVNNLLATNATFAQQTGPSTLTAFNTTGFNLGSDPDGYGTNTSAATYASWTFRKQPKFFDVVTYTGTGSARTVAHNLGSVPGCIIIKNLTDADGWLVYHRSIGATKTLSLNTTGAEVTNGNLSFNNTEPTSTVFTVNTAARANQSGNNYVAYLFAHDAGGFGLTGTDNVISCGSFTTDGSGNATVTLGYEPQWIMAKASSGTTSDWFMYDNMRGLDVSNGVYLRANSTASETSTSPMRINATGFSVANSTFDSSSTYVYIAIRRGPMKVPTDATKVFLPSVQAESGGAVVSTSFPVDMFIDSSRASNTYNMSWFDRLRGNSAGLLRSPSTAAETSLGTTPFGTVQNGVVPGMFSTSPVQWLFGRAPSFFDEVCYTGDGTETRTLAHNLTVAPEWIILRKRNSSGYWYTYFNFGSTSCGIAQLEDAGAASTTDYTGSFSKMGGAPTSSSFFVTNPAFGETNLSGTTYVAYLFATCAGVSKVGSYTGNGTTQTINCGFGAGGARFVLIKRTDSTGSWYVYDTARGMTVLTDPYLLMNSTAAEVTNTDYVDTYSAGFEISSTAPSAINASGGTFIFLAIA